VIVDDFNVVRVAVRPPKAHTPLIVDPNAVLAEAVAVQFLQAIPRRKPQFIEANCSVDLHELPQHDTPQIRRKMTDGFAAPQALGVSVRKASDHPKA
jgi:hypothetical protein